MQQRQHTVAHSMKFTISSPPNLHQAGRLAGTTRTPRAVDGTCHTTPSPQHNIRTYPSPSRRFAGRRADTSGPSSLLNCAFQSDPLNNMNRPATRRGRISVATAQMP